MYAAQLSRIDDVAEVSHCDMTDVSFLLQPYTPHSIKVLLDRRMYAVQSEAEANWVWHAFRGFALTEKKLAARCFRPHSFAAVGSGSGIDAIGAAHIFPTLRRIVVTDVEAAFVGVAAANVQANVRDDIKVEGLAGDLCEPLVEAGGLYDVIYTNLPNIPLAVAADDIIDYGTFYRPDDAPAADLLLGSYLLGLQHRFLLSARQVLSPRGCALMMIGGRFPYRLFDRLARTAGFALEEVLCCFKLQTEAENVVSGYAAHETDEVAFDFYDFDAARATLRGGAAQRPRAEAGAAAVADVGA
jgi:methylase of polypeptide subunit release factors